MQKKWAFLVILILSTLVYAETSYNFLTKGFADTLYCRINGNCVLNSLNVTTFNAVNITAVNYNVTGVVNAYGYNINGTPLQINSSFNQSFTDSQYVKKSGDTMSGKLNITDQLNVTGISQFKDIIIDDTIYDKSSTTSVFFEAGALVVEG